MLTSCNPHYLLHQAVCHTGSGGPTDSCVAAASHVLAHNPLSCMYIHQTMRICRVYLTRGGGGKRHIREIFWGGGEGNMKTHLAVYE